MIGKARRYKTATVCTVQDDSYTIMLDTNPVQTPVGTLLQLPSLALAKAIAAEWNAQAMDIKPATMPMTQLAMTAQDRTVDFAAMLSFLATDLIAHYAEDSRLRLEEERHWQPLHAWLRQRFDAVLPVAIGVLPSRKPAQYGTLESYLARLDHYRLLTVRELACALGSLTLAMALYEGANTVAQIVTAATIDDTYQMQRWGKDPTIQQRQTDLQIDIEQLCQFLALLN